MYKNVGTLLKHIYKLHKSLLALINHLVTQVTNQQCTGSAMGCQAEKGKRAGSFDPTRLPRVRNSTNSRNTPGDLARMFHVKHPIRTPQSAPWNTVSVSRQRCWTAVRAVWAAVGRPPGATRRWLAKYAPAMPSGFAG